ncbi:hypothetical protein ACSA002_0500 [Salmonella phage vB_SalM_SA002]|nr:hypothetical protein ACSA002_0500 [Salmonella phage vB_SalM_SA002]
MFLKRSYYLPDYKHHVQLPKLFLRIRSVAIKFKGAPEAIYITPDESHSIEIRNMVRMGGTVGCDVNLAIGTVSLAWHISAGWRNGVFQLWVHGLAGGVIPKPDDERLELVSWEIYEYSLYAEPNNDRKFPYVHDKPIDNYDTRDEVVLNQNRYGFEIMARLKAQYDYDTKTTVDLATLQPNDVVTTVILRRHRQVLGYLSFKDDVNAFAIATELRRLVPAEDWYDCEVEMMDIAEFLVNSRRWDLSIPRHKRTARFSSESTHCTLGRSVFSCEDGEPKFKLFKEDPTDGIV